MPSDQTRTPPSVVVAALLALAFAGCGGAEEKPAPTSDTTAERSPSSGGTIDTTPQVESASGTAKGFGGFWTWSNERDGLELSLTQSGSRVSGHHEAWTQYGDKVDIVDEDEVSSINGTVASGVATVVFRSGVSGKEGHATLRQSAGTLVWEVTSMPEGECYIPKKATLKRSEPDEGVEDQPELDEGAAAQREERRARSTPAAKDQGTGSTETDGGGAPKSSSGGSASGEGN